MRKWLREIRENQHMTQDEVAHMAGFSRTYYTRIECSIRGHKLPVSTAQQIAFVLHFDWQRFYEEK
jgi:transcriptional regulator with XRE-family HTH domain